MAGGDRDVYRTVVTFRCTMVIDFGEGFEAMREVFVGGISCQASERVSRIDSLQTTHKIILARFPDFVYSELAKFRKSSFQTPETHFPN